MDTNRNSLVDLKKDSIKIYSKENENKVNSKNRKTTSRSKIRQKSSASSKTFKNALNDLDKMNNNDVNNLEPNSNELYINSNYVRNDSTEKNSDVKSDLNDNIIEKIKINLLCLYCLNKKKNLQKLLFDEGTKLISINLDIMNMFDKLYLVEKMQKNLNIDGSTIEMRENVKRKIDAIRNIILLS